MDGLTFTKLGGLLSETVNKPDVDFFSCANVLSKLTKQDFISLINNLLIMINENQKVSTSEEEHVYLYRQNGVNLLIRFANSATQGKMFLASEADAVLVNLSGTVLSIPFYKCSINPDDLAQRPKALEQQEDVRLNSYEPFCLKAFSGILDFYQASRVAPLLIVHSDKRAWSTWAFDRESLEAVRRVSTDLRASRLQLTLALFQAMNVKEINPILRSLILSNYAGNVRWDALKFYYQLDKEDATRLIKQLAESDDDPAVRRVAQKTLHSIR